MTCLAGIALATSGPLWGQALPDPAPGSPGLASRDTALERVGFYRRQARGGQGSRAVFIGPEQTQRRPLRVSQLLESAGIVRIYRHNGRVVVSGRREDCAVSIAIDGLVQRQTMESRFTPLGSEQIQRRGVPWAPGSYFEHPSIDELVAVGSVAAIEIYPNATAVPVELQQNFFERGCAIVYIWTGAAAP